MYLHDRIIIIFKNIDFKLFSNVMQQRLYVFIFEILFKELEKSQNRIERFGVIFSI